MEEKKKKRWLIVAVVVVCLGVGGIVVLGVLLGIGVPAWQSSVRAANEVAASKTLSAIAVEELMYFKGHGRYATFDELIQDGALDKRFAGASPTVAGYTFTLNVTQKSTGAPSTFGVNADPQQSEGFGATGRRHFYINSTDTVIHYNEAQQATADDPVPGNEP
jgi:type II secretory pathway pseudopilin PulG